MSEVTAYSCDFKDCGATAVPGRSYPPDGWLQTNIYGPDRAKRHFCPAHKVIIAEAIRVTGGPLDSTAMQVKP